jgi:hypothetical protein
MAKRGRKKKNTKTNTKPALGDNTTATMAGTKTPNVINKFKRRGWIFTGISVVSILFVISGYWFITQSVSASFTAKLTQVGDIELGFSERQSRKISPLCGCNDVGEWGNWRGITFTARNVEIERKGDLPATGYLIFAPPPTSTTFGPDFFKIKITYYLIEISKNETFNPRFLLSGTLPENYKLIQKENSDEGFVQFFSEKSLKVSLLGDKPLGAWIPMERTNVSINYQLRQKIAEPITTVIRETYLASTKEGLDQVVAKGFWDDSMKALPVGDFLGPNVIFWSEDEPTSILTSSKVIYIHKDEIAGKKFIKAVVVNPPFAVRVVSIPFDESVILRAVAEAPKRKEKDYSYIGSQGRFDSGEVNVKIYTPDNQAEEFEKIYQSMKQQGTTVSDFKTYYSSEIAGGKMEFRYPPIPPNNGFNIFGEINKLKIDSVLGNLLIGSRSFNIEAPATIELKDIKKLEVKGGVMEIPIQMGIADTPSKIQLKATSEIYVNDESITQRKDNNKTFIDYVVLIAAVLGIVSTIVSAIIAVKDFRKA